MRRIDFMLQDVETSARIFAEHMCDQISAKVECDDCPFTDRCGRGHNGVLDYLMEEVQDAE